MRNSARNWVRIGALAGIAGGAIALVLAQGKPITSSSGDENVQQPTVTVPGKGNIPAGYGTMHMTTNVGSFRVNSPGDDLARGKISMSFSGTVLVSGIKNGTVTPGPGVERQYFNEAHNKQVFFGKGSLVIDGSFKAVQWFGRNLDATYVGIGLVQLYGEFDKDLNTGYYWYDDPKDKKFWSPNGPVVTNPETKIASETIKPQQRPGS